MFVQSGGCCAGSTPMCFPAGEFVVGDGDLLLGEIDGCPFYIDAASTRRGIRTFHARRRRGQPEGFSLAAGDDLHFVLGSEAVAHLTRARLYDRRRPAVLDRVGLDELVAVLIAEGYRVVGPTVRDDAIVLAELESGAELPAGWGVEAAPGRYRLHRRDDAAVFAHSAGPQSWKQFLHPPRSGCGPTRRRDVHPGAARSRSRYAFLGVRGCDLAAIAVLGRVLGGGAHPDGSFTPPAQRACSSSRSGCTEPGGVCFCASMGTGPAPGPGYDLSLTERIDDAGHRFVVDVGTDEGARDPRPRSTTAPATERRGRRRARGGRRRRPTTWAARCRPATSARCCATAATRPHWEEVAEPLPDLRQLHDGLPDLLLHHDRGRHRPHRRARRALAALGVLLRARLLLPARRQRASVRREPLPAVDHAQAEHLARPVRRVRMRRLRPVHRLVPGRASTSPPRSPRSPRNATRPVRGATDD